MNEDDFLLEWMEREEKRRIRDLEYIEEQRALTNAEILSRERMRLQQEEDEKTLKAQLWQQYLDAKARGNPAEIEAAAAACGLKRHVEGQKVYYV